MTCITTTINTNILRCVDAGISSELAPRNLNLIGAAAVMRIWRSGESAPALELLWGPTTSAYSYSTIWQITTGTNVSFFTITDRTGTLGTFNTRLIIDNNGNVGIGTTTNASYKLNVPGPFNATSIYENGTLITNNYYNSHDNPNSRNTKRQKMDEVFGDASEKLANKNYSIIIFDKLIILYYHDYHYRDKEILSEFGKYSKDIHEVFETVRIKMIKNKSRVDFQYIPINNFDDEFEMDNIHDLYRIFKKLIDCGL